MTKLNSWVYAARLRTLPLSISGIVTGGGLAAYYGNFNGLIFFLSLCTTIGFQITSNFANDYGDGVKGTDNAERIGPARALQSGKLGRRELKRGILVSVIINGLLALFLLLTAFGWEELYYLLLFSGLAVLSIWAAIKYTVGRSAYGYQGLGDIFVFLFFGLVGVLGSMFLYLKTVPFVAVYWAITIGALSVGVLNLNNLRDVVSDGKSGKNTLVVRMGYAKGKIYHLVLLLVAFVSVAAFIWQTQTHPMHFLSLLLFVPIAFHGRRVLRNTRPADMDPELKKLA